nr:unnamed protein product [Spirometra erinaceieuropaei]
MLVTVTNSDVKRWGLLPPLHPENEAAIPATEMASKARALLQFASPCAPPLSRYLRLPPPTPGPATRVITVSNLPSRTLLRMNPVVPDPLLHLPDPLSLRPVYFLCSHARKPQLQLPLHQPTTL